MNQKLEYPFQPLLGTENTVLNYNTVPGAVYFTTDTRKIYLDIDSNREKIPMGGNIGLFYGTMELDVPAVDGQEEFEFSILDIVGNEAGKQLLKPNIDDLILNSDGCFYKVIDSRGEDIEIELTTKKLTIAGSGGGGGGSITDPTSKQSFAVSALKVDYPAVLYGQSCPIAFATKATDDLGDYLSGPVGSYTVYVNKIKKTSGIVNGISSGQLDDFSSIINEEFTIIDVGPYLTLGDKNNIVIEIIGDRGGNAVRGVNIPTTDMKLTWNYDETTLNHWITSGAIKDSMTLTWKVSGLGLNKTTYMSINDEPPIEIATGPQEEFDYELVFSDHHLYHGVHSIKLWAETQIGGQTPPTEPVYKNILIVKDNDTSTLISVGLFEKELTQYNTVKIPIFIYSPVNTAGDAIIKLIENGAEKDTWEDISNFEIRNWSYTPVEAGENIILTVQSGGKEKSINISVKSIGVDINEKSGYAFKFKSTEFSSNDSVRNWNSNGYIATFSDNFDWINGGLQSEDDEEGGHRQCVIVKAGTRMSINYNMWEKNPPGNGKHLKVIFKATNCRDYDSTVLTSKNDKQIIHTDMSLEYYWLTESETTLNYSKNVRINNNAIELINPVDGVLNIEDKSSRELFENAYVIFEGEVYRCNFLQLDKENNPDKYYAAWYKTTVQDSFNGLILKAQNATINTNNLSMTTQYCENNYIELELEVTQALSGKQYIKFWIDGIPSNYVTYTTNDRFSGGSQIEIGSDDCDVCVYLVKLYEEELTIQNHMDNFFADAPNAEEMVRRYKRNDIMDDNRRKEINPQKLAKANPECLVHIYDIPNIPTTKKDETYPCRYEQYQGSSDAKIYADGVMIKVQGTSSEKYVVSAANLDTDFNYTKNNNVPSGIIDANTGEKLENGWSMDGGKAIPVDFFCTKVNVASCENANNAMNQEWYNLFQPYKSVLRCKNENARDTMQFTNGVLFLIDRNSTFNTAANANKKMNNVFGEVENYIKDPYAKMYSIGQMGNSKNNIHVFHDLENPKECCVEVKDNQTPQQWMVSDDYIKTDAGEEQGYFEFRYPDGASNASQEMIDGWNRLVTWFATNDPSPAYNKFINITTEEQFKQFAINKKTLQKVKTYIMTEDETDYIEIQNFDPSISTYYTLTDHPNGYTNKKLKDTDQKIFAPYTFRGFRAEEQKRPGTNELWQKDYNPVIAGYTISTYANNGENDTPYTHDTYEYRMAKMLSECEDYLIMDSVLFHFLFIERHCMVDNVAKNTFWSTEDCQHWALIKDYDNDTADGNDNNGKFTRTYGMEPLDKLNANAYVFNAHQSVWFNFINGLKDACTYMYQQLENKTIKYQNRNISVWNAKDYIWLFDKWQKMIPERCWIEDYSRKYFRPAELYGDTMFSEMMEGGQKKYQRRQYETYQDIFMASKYDGKTFLDSAINFRPTGDNVKDLELPLTVYSDCYVKMELGSDKSKERIRRNTPAKIVCPTNNLNNATMYLYPASSFTTLGSKTGGQIGHFAPDQGSFSNAPKLKELVFATADNPIRNTGWTGALTFEANPLLEKLYIANLLNCNRDLTLTQCPSLKELDASNSGFTGIELTDGAPTEKIILNTPTSLTLSNLSNLKELTLNYSKLNTLKLTNIDNEHIDTKTIVETALNTLEANGAQEKLEYKLTKVDWSIDEANEIQNNGIKLLDTLLNTEKALPAFKDDLIERYSYPEALTGKVAVSAAAYSESSDKALALHDKYVNKDCFADVDLDFESTNSTLYTVTIYNGDGVEIWKRKAIQGTEITKTFLITGPEGSFNPSSLEKSPTAENTYTFLQTWKAKKEDGTLIEEISAVNTEGYPVGLTVTQDIHLYPDFRVEPRSYLVSVKSKHPATGAIDILLNEKFVFGTSLQEVLNELTTRPYADSSNLKLEQVYDFIGYSLIEGGATKVSDSFKIAGETTLWAIFKLEENVRKVVHPEWFNIRSYEYSYLVDKQFYGAVGVELSPRYPDLAGKITIPAFVTYEGMEKPVLSIKGFGSTSSTQDSTYSISHVFMEADKENKLYNIGENAFRGCSTLVYFDFDHCAVRRVQPYAFQRTNLTNTTFGNQLLYVGQSGFNQSLVVHNGTLRLPSTLQGVGSNAFSALKVTGTEGSVYPALDIGSQDNPSPLTFEAILDDPLAQNDGHKFRSINFYSSIYSSIDPGSLLHTILYEEAFDTQSGREVNLEYIEKT